MNGRRVACGVMGAIAASVTLALPSAASAAITSVLGGDTMSGTAITCTAQSDGVRVCNGGDGGVGGTDLRLKSFDGSPLALYVILPPAPSSGADGPYPLVVQSHGWAGQAGGPTDTDLGPSADTWAKQGYAVLQLTARGFGDSCGSSESRAINPTACENGYIRLDDDRYEVRDIQNAVGLLVDEKIADPARIGATGDSYGGGVSLQLATLRDRVMNADGTLSPWTSPAGTPLKLAAAAPLIPWSDLVNSLVQNGHTLDYQVAGPTTDLSPAGVEKQSFVSGLFADAPAGNGYYAPPMTNSQADLTTWFADLNEGEPYDTNSTDQAILTQIAQYHSAYYLLDGKYGAAQEAPPPLLIANGFTDDLFPVDEAIRYYNLEQSLYPSDPIGLFDWDGGHMRGQNKPADNAMLAGRVESFFDHYVKGTGAQPQLGATALTQTCPSTAPSGGPYTAPTWAMLHPGEVDYSAAAAQTIQSTAGDVSVAKTFDPIAGGGACATASATPEGAGVATYRLPAATGSGYTLLGAPTVIANLTASGQYPYIAARLLDVDPAGNTETLVDRVVYRLDPNAPDGLQVFQLHPGAWHFAAGHIPELELLGRDPPYARISNGTFSIAVTDLQLRLPVHETPGAAGVPTAVTTPQPTVTPHPTNGACKALPTSRINQHRTKASPHGIALAGSAGEALCANASAATHKRQKILKVYVFAYQLHGKRCRFLRASGRLSSLRSCHSPVRLATRGTTSWTLRLSHSIPRGHYHVRSQAVDGFHHHQHASRASFAFFTIH